MRLAGIVALGALGLLGSCGGEPERPLTRYSIEQFLDTTAISGGSFSHDESKVLYSSDASGTFNLYSVPATGGTPRQLTESTEDSYFAVSYFPTDDRALFTADHGGNEIYHLYVRELDGSVRELTPGEGNRALFHAWSMDRKRFYYTSNSRDPQYMDLYAMDATTYEPQMLYENTGGYYTEAVSPDERYVALEKVRTEHDMDIYVHDRKTGATRHLTPHEGDVVNDPEFFSADGEWLYSLTDAGREFLYVVRTNVQSLEREVVEQAEWDIVSASRSQSGKYAVYTVNADARSELRVYEMASGKRVALPALPAGDITGANVSPTEDKLLFYHAGDRSPRNLYVLQMDTGEHVQLTDTLNPAIDTEDLVDAEVVRYASFDGTGIPAILMKPKLMRDEKAPAIVEVHGGPGGQSRLGYSALYQYLVNHGYAVLRVNNRGSSGYGKTFFQMDDRKHGDADLKDCIWGKKYLQSLDYVDGDKVGILGGSYGGYMVLAALAFTPDEFAVGVDIFGVANWLRTLKSIPPWWAAMRDALYGELGDPEKDEEYLRQISPLFHAEQIRKPLIVLQGANDPRVLKVESDEIVEAVKQNGVPVEYLVFENEGHGFTQKANRIRGYEAILRFLDEHLKGAGS